VSSCALSDSEWRFTPSVRWAVALAPASTGVEGKHRKARLFFSSLSLCLPLLFTSLPPSLSSPPRSMAPAAPAGLASVAVAVAVLAAAASAAVTYDRKAVVVNGQRRILMSGSIHYPRSVPEVRAAFLLVFILPSFLRSMASFSSPRKCGLAGPPLELV
jgi:hypothetical protein